MEVSEDITLATHKANCFRGLVRVRLDCLQFEHQLFLNKHREASPQNVRRLQKIFEKTGCLRLQDENVIDAVVEDARLDAALRAIGLSIEALQKVRSPKDAPTLHLRELKCLNGLHRIRAADQFLDENDKWWVVRLFSSESPTPILFHMVDSYINEQKPSDGEIFRRIRLYRLENKVEAERKWWARLDNSKPKDLRQLFKRREIISGFDRLLEMPGLWAKVQLGALHRLLTLKCDEEMANYLSHISKVWTKILTCRNVTLPFSAVDTITVESLESLAPKHSSIDKAYVLDLFKRNIIFPSQLDSGIRQELAENVCASEGLIPSLWTFFETLKYIEPICEILKKLVGSNMRRTIRSSLMGHYFPPERRHIQVSKLREAEITSLLSREEAAWISYVELWAFCGRYFAKLTSFTPKKESGEVKPVVEGPNPVLWRHLANFSVSRGFKTKPAEKLANSDPYTELAHEYLRKSSPLSSLSCERQIQEVLRASRIVDDDSQQPQSVLSGHLEKERRSGRPYENVLRMDERNLYLPNIYNSEEPVEANWTLIRRDMFHSLFGKLVVKHSDIQHPIFVNGFSSNTDEMDLETGDIHTPNEIEGLKMEIETLRRDHSDLLLQLENLQMRHQNLETEKLDLQQRCQFFQDQGNTDKDFISSLQSNVEALQKRNKELEAENLDFNQRYQSLQDQRNGEIDAISSLALKQHEIEHLRVENDTLNKKIETFETAVQQRTQITQNSQALVLKLRKDLQKLESKQAATQNELATLRSDHSRLLEENREHKNTIQTANEQRNAVILRHEQLFAQTIPTEPEYEDPKCAFLNDLRERELHNPWRPYGGDKYEIFLAESNDDTGLPKGTPIEVDKDETEAVPIIVAIIGAARQYFGQDLRAMSIQGKYLTNISPTYIFAACTMYRTILISKDAVLERYVSTGACQDVIAKLGGGNLELVGGAQRHMIEEADGTKKRRLENDLSGNEVVPRTQKMISGNGTADVVP